jgi:hypothetical protein
MKTRRVSSLKWSMHMHVTGFGSTDCFCTRIYTCLRLTWCLVVCVDARDRDRHVLNFHHVPTINIPQFTLAIGLKLTLTSIMFQNQIREQQLIMIMHMHAQQGHAQASSITEMTTCDFLFYCFKPPYLRTLFRRDACLKAT